jgi:hypothetical protein
VASKNTRHFRRRDAVLDYSAATVGTGVEVPRAEVAGGRQSWPAGSPALDAERDRRIAVYADLAAATIAVGDSVTVDPTDATP